MIFLNPKLSGRPELRSTREGHADALVELGKKDRRVVALSADVSPSTYYDKFAAAFPERFIECGVAEQNMMGAAAGLALSGKIPFLASFAAFSPGRNWEQLRISVCYTKANVKIAATHAGLSVGEDGASHQALEDVALTRVLPNLTVISPCDYEEAKKATFAAAKIAGPVYLRLFRPATPVLTAPKTPFQIGRAEIFQEGKNVTVIAAGPILYEAWLAVQELKRQNIFAELINCHTIKPLDKKTIIQSLKKTGRAVTVEDHQIYGGLGGAIAELAARHCPAPMEFIGVRDSFGESGPADKLLKKHHLKARDIIAAVKKVINQDSLF